MTLGWVADAVKGRLIDGDAGREVGDVAIDSRVVEPGGLFVAIKGPRFDGHDFVGDVLARGAAGVIVQAPGLRPQAPELSEARGPRPAGFTGVIEVHDTLAALQDLAHAVRVAAGTKVVAITGSAGKTTTKEAIAEFLATRWRVVKNEGNLNNHIGLPLSLMQLRTGPDVAVMELGMNHRGEISTLVAIAEPDVRVWTNVGDAHLGFFSSPDEIADAKAEILESADAGDLLVCNGDDERVMARARSFGGRTMTFGTAEDCDVRASDVEDRGIDGMRARVTTPAGARVIETALLGRGNLANVLAATAVALDADVPLDTIVDAAARLGPAPRRGAVHRLAGGVTLVDDSYNSSPAALRRALDVVAHATATARRLAVLGEMLELGDHADRLHAECGRVAASSGLDLLFTVGGRPAQVMADAAIAAGMAERAVSYFEDSAAAADAVARVIREGDLVLVKGSRGIRTDVVADRIAGLTRPAPREGLG